MAAGGTCTGRATARGRRRGRGRGTGACSLCSLGCPPPPSSPLSWPLPPHLRSARLSSVWVCESAGQLLWCSLSARVGAGRAGSGRVEQGRAGSGRVCRSLVWCYTHRLARRLTPLTHSLAHSPITAHASLAITQHITSPRESLHYHGHYHCAGGTSCPQQLCGARGGEGRGNHSSGSLDRITTQSRLECGACWRGGAARRGEARRRG